MFIYLLSSDWLSYQGILPTPLGIKHLLLLFFPVLYGIQNTIKVDKQYFALLVFTVLYSFFNFLILDYSFLNYSVGLLFTFVGFFTFLYSSQMTLSEDRIIGILKVIVFFNLFACSVSITQSLISFESLRYSPGIFRESGALADSLSFALLSSLYIYYKTNSKLFFNLVIFFGIVVLATTLKKSILSVLMISTLHIIYTKPKLSFKYVLVIFVAIIISIPALIDNVNENTAYLDNVGAEGHVRIAMYITSVSILVDYFPFGCGLGQFGSFGSILGSFDFPFKITYVFSDVYHNYGIADLAGNSEIRAAEGGLTHLDTYWPHIIGELGFIGFILFLFLWFFPMLKIRNRKEIVPEKIFIIGSILQMTIVGTGLIQPEVPLFIFYNFFVVGLIYSSIRSKKVV